MKGRVKWDQNASFQARSVAVIEAMAARYGRNSALLGFGLLNEPIVRAADLMLCSPRPDPRPNPTPTFDLVTWSKMAVTFISVSIQPVLAPAVDDSRSAAGSTEQMSLLPMSVVHDCRCACSFLHHVCVRRDSKKLPGCEPCVNGSPTSCVVQVNSGPLQAYYMAAYAAVRKHSSSCFVAIAPRVYEQDGFEWQHFMTGPGYTNVLQDLHRCAQLGLRQSTPWPTVWDNTTLVRHACVPQR